MKYNNLRKIIVTEKKTMNCKAEDFTVNYVITLPITLSVLIKAYG